MSIVPIVDPFDDRYILFPDGTRLFRVRGGSPDDPNPDPDPDPDPNPDPAPDPDPNPDPPEDTVSAAKFKEAQDELNRLKREAAERDKERKAADRKKAEEEGRYKELLELAEKERDEAKAAIDSITSERDKAERKAKVTALATSMSFQDPSDVMALLKEDHDADSDIWSDDKALERELNRLATKKPYLRDEKRRRSSAPAGGGTDGQLSRADLKDMSPEAINKAREDGRLNELLGVK